MTREDFLKLLGPFPEKVGLNAITLESVDCGKYVREKVEYNVEAGERVGSYFLFPKNAAGKTPAVFCHHQHASNYNLGKSEMAGISGDSDLAYAKELAERGYITFAPDAIAFEERNWHQKKESWWGTEYFELTTRLIRGQTLMAKVLHDLMIGIDYLISRSEVDETKIGFIGHSYGGRMALFVPVIDWRIKAAVSNCYCVSYKSASLKTSDTRIPMELCIPNIARYGDIGDVVRMVEPAALFISAAADDKWSRDALEIYNYAKPAFIKGELKIKIWPGGHAFTREMRSEAYAFLDKHLGKISA